MRIAVDAMGGDHAPSAIVEGAIRAARELSQVERLFLVGDEATVRAGVAAFADAGTTDFAPVEIGLDERDQVATRELLKELAAS